MRARNTRLTDLLVPIAVVAIVGMMIFPLPSDLIDVLLMFNISLSLVLLLSAVYLSEPERFTALPSLLLLSTLFRLGLNVSTTRQILSTAQAPDVVAAFGNFVVGGNLVVGAVIFIIITLVQFMVIAKGAERVAEVAARFTLDAMPGKQMAIDSDVRAGIISMAEARERRLDLQREAKLYGALDGAMKFVKGDTVAGLLITLINITAGLFIGVSEYGLSIAVALHRYTIFTIGDGLVAQIPALLTAVAAGIVVTRVSDREGSFLGREVFLQLGREPQALGAASVLLIGLAFAPGLPMAPFVSMSVLLAVLARRGEKAADLAARDKADGDFRPPVFHGFSFRMTPQAALILQRENHFAASAKATRNARFEQTGVIVPEFHFELARGNEQARVELCLFGVQLAEVVAGNKETNFTARVMQKLNELLDEHLPELVDDTHTRVLFDLHSAVADDLINSLVPKQIALTNVTTMLRALVQEKVSIRNLPLILQAVAEFHAGVDENLKANKDELLIAVRTKLARVVTQSIADSNWNVSIWLLEENVDRAISQAALTSSHLPLEVRTALEAEAAERFAADAGPSTALLTTRFARAATRRIIEMAAPGCRVIAVDELSPEAKIQVKGVFGERAGATLLAPCAASAVPRRGEVLPFERKAA